MRNKAVTGRKLAAALAVFAAALAFGNRWDNSVQAAESSVIEKVTVTFKDNFGEPEEIPEPEITVSGSGCSLGDIQFRTDYDKWKPGKKVRVEITVIADGGKLFPASLNRSQCKVSGADFVSAKALDDASLQVKADYRPIMVLGDTERAGWSSTSKKRAVWKSVPYAPGYTLTLYGDNKVVKRLNTETNSANLTEYMKDTDKTYYYEVKAVPLTSDEKKYLKEGSYVTSTDQEFDWTDTEEGSRREPGGAGDGGSLKGGSYVLPDGRKETDVWKKISGSWYYFDGNGAMATGWLANGGKWYYMNQDGKMATGWINLNNGSWFLLADSGEMLTGWQQPQPGSWYYLNQNGYMERNWILVNGKWYYMGDDGRMATGWVNVNGLWYYLYSDGSMAVNTTVEGWTINGDGAALQR
ncbi:MAG: N-acetylmuramoyl-L-alanine amidase family protein [Clostridium sp.]|nr:N-acetylmuramoyl-L-alanine amidase family protein [Clostridium sp.]